MLIIGIVLALSGSHNAPNDLTASGHSVVEPIAAKEPAFDPVVVELTANNVVDSAISAKAFGLQTSEYLLHMDDILYGLEVPETEAPLAAAPQDSKDSDAAPSNSKNRKKRSHDSEEKEVNAPAEESSDSDLSQFRFTLNYSPKTAKVGFLNAFGQCSDGVCTLETTSDKTPARIVISAPGYVSRSLLIKKKVSNIQIDLVAETDSE